MKPEDRKSAAHTPGPWQVIPAHEAQSPWVVGAREGGSIADCEPPGPWISDAEATANARLIAAAPDMLAALKECVSAAEPLGGHDGFIDRARAAVRKAEGRS